MRLNKRQMIEATHSIHKLESWGLSRWEIDALRRIQMTLHRWSENECGTDYGCIERDEATNKPYIVREMNLGGKWQTRRHRQG